jgi:hypothetical protein
VSAGYSGTPLGKKLNLKDGMRVWREGMPKSVGDEIAAEGLQVQLLESPRAPIDAAHLFVISRGELEAKLHELMPLLAPLGMIWVSWPHQSSNVPTDITAGEFRVICLQMWLVDVKVCAIDATWSGLKLVIRRENRDVR